VRRCAARPEVALRRLQQVKLLQRTLGSQLFARNRRHAMRLGQGLAPLDWAAAEVTLLRTSTCQEGKKQQGKQQTDQ
jgi:hypothetical protein